MNSTSWNDIKADSLPTSLGEAAYDSEASIAEFRQLAFAVRTNAGFTQAQIAERMGTTQSAIARLEGGGTKPTLQTLENLAAALGLTS